MVKVRFGALEPSILEFRVSTGVRGRRGGDVAALLFPGSSKKKARRSAAALPMSNRLRDARARLRRQFREPSKLRPSPTRMWDGLQRRWSA